MKQHKYTNLSILLLSLLAISAVLAAFGMPIHYASAAEEGTTAAAQVYLPLVAKSGGKSDPATVTPTATATKPQQPPPAPEVKSGLFVDSTWKTSNASVVVDAAGGQHRAFYYYESEFDQRPRYALYSYCATQCEKTESWKSVTFLDDVNEVQLAVTSAGKPRLLIRTPTPGGVIGNDYSYAACDSDCTKLDQWSITPVRSYKGMASFEVQDDALPQRSFALDPAGHPRFVYNDRSNNNYGTFFVYCDTQCDKQESWQQVRINKVIQSPQYRDDDFYYPTLTFTADGKPRVVTAEFFPLDDSNRSLAYIECNEACNDPESWHAVKLIETGSGAEPSADLAIDGEGRPRIVFYQEGLLEGKGNVLYYLWCDHNCLDASQWQKRELGLGTMNGQEPDLELDKTGHPRIAYTMFNGGGVGVLWCNVDCETQNGKWESKVLEDGAKLYQAWPVAYPANCDGGIWNGHTPKLVLSPVGDPQIAFDGTYHARCFYDDNPSDNKPPTFEFHLIVRAVRVIAFTAPATLPDSGVPTDTKTPTPTRTPTATQSPTVTPTATRTPVTINKAIALFAETQDKTSNASVVVDGNGGKHMAFYYDEAPGASYAVYRFCSSGCETSGNWKEVSFAQNVNEVQLELDPTGNPHLLIRTQPNASEDHYEYLYAVCEGNCTQPNGWNSLTVANSNGGKNYEQNDPSQPQRSFELDPNGRPRFVYVDDTRTVDPIHTGVYYVWCDTTCTDSAQWQETRITELEVWDGQIDKLEKAYYLTLKFTSNGAPRLITAEYYPALVLTGTTWELAYFECDDMCDQGYLWSKVKLGDNGEGPLPSADLEIDAAGHPHVAYYQEKTSGVLPDGSLTTPIQNLFYLSCVESNCRMHMNWKSAHTGKSGLDGGAPDLELDGQGRPRIVYQLGKSGGLGYSWCNSDCLTYADNAWKHGVIETRAELQTALPKSHPGTCDAGGWSGLTPTFVLSNSGTAHVAYDAAYIAHCAHDGTWQDDVLMRAARVVVFSEP